MFSQSGVSASSARVPVDIRRFPWINRLAADYAFDFTRLSDFYAGNPAEPAAWRDAITRTQQHDRSRDAVADLLQQGVEHKGAIAAPAGANQPPGARMTLDDSARGAVEELERVLPRTEFTGEMLDQLRRAYRPGAVTPVLPQGARWWLR